jgi:hypothetical protein
MIFIWLGIAWILFLACVLQIVKNLEKKGK